MRQSTFFEQGSDGPTLYFISDAGEAEAVLAILREQTAQPFRLLAFEAEDWNRDLSPWPAPAVFGNRDFAGRAADTLRDLLPWVDAPARDAVIGGYSLAGLFSLWAFYETGRFGTAVSCSGSLWYPGWTAYAQQKTPRSGAVYLSLGEKEPLSRNPHLAKVGECTERQYAICREQGCRCAMIHHPGGHFQEPAQRMAAGFLWALSDHPASGAASR